MGTHMCGHRIQGFFNLNEVGVGTFVSCVQSWMSSCMKVNVEGVEKLTPRVIWVTVLLLIDNKWISHNYQHRTTDYCKSSQRKWRMFRVMISCMICMIVWLIYLRILSYPSLGRTSTTYIFKDYTILYSLVYCLFKTKGNCLVRVLSHV